MIDQRYISRPSIPWTVGIFLVFFSSVWVSQAQELPPEVLGYADMVFYNGHVLTMDRDQPPINVVQAVAVRDGRILAVGESERILGMAGPATLKVDLEGKGVIPGVIDTHSHPNSYAFRHREFAQEVNQAYVELLRENHIQYTNARWESKETALADLERFAQNVPAGDWIFTGIGTNMRLFEIWKQITRDDLDRVVPNHPLFIKMGYGWWGLVNTKMLEVVRDNYGEKLLPGFVRDEQGVPNGRLLGVAGEVMDRELLPQIPPEVLAPGFKRELDEWVAIGVTTLSTRLAGYEISAYGLLDRGGELPLRLAYAHEIGRDNPFFERQVKRLGNLEGHGTDRIWMVGITIGNPDGYGPRIPAPDDGDRVGEISCVTLPKREILPNDMYPEGMCYWDLPDSPEGNAAIIANRYGYRITGLHTFGDKGTYMVLESYQKASLESSIKDRRFALDHGMMIRPDVRELSAELGLMWSLQPVQFWSRYAASVSRVYGEEYAHRWLFPVKSLIDQGVKLAYGADTHDDPERHPMFSLEILVTRKTRDGRVFGPRERIDRGTALLMMTRGGSEYVMAEDKLGSIDPGKLADLVVLDRNPLDRSIPDEDLSEIQVLATIIGGEVAYGSLD
jgi:predicted amidohydrolase YtcJ